MNDSDLAAARYFTAPDHGANLTFIIRLDILPMPHHLRAARALLGWSRAALAQASSLSQSTVKRIEEGDTLVSRKSRLRASIALSNAGIRFLTIGCSIVGVTNVDEISPVVSKKNLSNTTINVES